MILTSGILPGIIRLGKLTCANSCR